MENIKPSIYDQSYTTLQEYFLKIGEPGFRASQLWQELYKHICSDIESFSSFPKVLRQRIEDSFSFTHPIAIKKLESKDQKTLKQLFELEDGNSIETVLMRYNERNTLCISTQVGCPIGCVFCATGQMGFIRNLTSGEIIEQVLFFERVLRKEKNHLTNIVVMGMGEPFSNYDSTLQAIDILNDPSGFCFGARRFTISTVGIIPRIRQFASENRQINLAVSLHAANDVLRHTLIPHSKAYRLSELILACNEYVGKSHRRISFEWALIEGINDSPNDAKELAKLVNGLICHVNIIPLNAIAKFTGCPSPREKAEEFQRALLSAGIPCTIRLRRGIEINAGCGQLATESRKAA
jgi:23S rRNA (adenine2503-C2)-methyltransferase